MSNLFEICFLTGLVLIILSFLLGQFFNFLGIDGLGLDGGDVSLPFPFSPLLLFLFVTLFGGNGLLFLLLFPSMPSILVLLLSTTIGILICYLIQRFVIKKLYNAQNTSAADTEELIGLLATVSETIRDDKFGEISYTIHGNSYLAPAKSTDGQSLIAGTCVSICWIEDHVFYVTNI